jgi:hypothetical protein
VIVAVVVLLVVPAAEPVTVSVLVVPRRALPVTLTFNFVLPPGETGFGDAMLGVMPVVPPVTVSVTGFVKAPTGLTLTV